VQNIEHGHLHDSDQTKRIKKTKALLTSIGLYPDGSPARLPLRHVLMYGSAAKRVQSHIVTARKDAESIRNFISNLETQQEFFREAVLIQAFILGKSISYFLLPD
jgi:hypothetical protein